MVEGGHRKGGEAGERGKGDKHLFAMRRESKREDEDEDRRQGMEGTREGGNRGGNEDL